MGVSGYLIWSGLLLGSFLVIIFICWFAVFLYRYHQLKKFKDHGGKVSEQKTIYWVSISIFAFSLVFYLISLVMGVLYLVNEQNKLPSQADGIVFEVMFLIYIIAIFVFLVLLLIYQNTIILVVKNDTLLTLNTIIDIKSILQIRRDNKRQWIFINWKDASQNRVREIKLRYSYKVKDYLKENGLWQEQEPII